MRPPVPSELREQIRQAVYAAAADPANDLKACRIATDAADRVIAVVAAEDLTPRAEAER
jgi:hypothetical protein